MKRVGQMIGLLWMVSSLSAPGPVLAVDGMISKEESIPGSYCHMQFPAMDEQTLSSDRPLLKNDGDVIDFYGSCEETPTGKDQVAAQKLDEQHRWSEYGGGR